MRIGIDISPACRVKKTGIEWYAWHIVHALIKQESRDISFRLYADGPCSEYVGASQMRSLQWPSRYFWSEFRLSWEMLRFPPDVLFVPARALPIVLPQRVVTTLHDVGFIPFPAERKRLSREYLLHTSRRAAHRADRILTVSEFSKQEIMRYFHVASEKIAVVYLGYDRARYTPHTSSRSERPTILFIGRRERRKNLLTLIRAFEILTQRLRTADVELMIVGPSGHHAYEIDAAVAQSPAKDRIRIMDWVSEERKVELLRRAIVYVQPSIYEGFGLPVIEAQACGTAVVCARAASLPEIAGTGALFFDPISAESCAEALEHLLISPALQNQLIDAGFENCSRFSWELAAKETLSCFTRLS